MLKRRIELFGCVLLLMVPYITLIAPFINTGTAAACSGPSFDINSFNSENMASMTLKAGSCHKKGLSTSFTYAPDQAAGNSQNGIAVTYYEGTAVNGCPQDFLSYNVLTNSLQYSTVVAVAGPGNPVPTSKQLPFGGDPNCEVKSGPAHAAINTNAISADCALQFDINTNNTITPDSASCPLVEAALSGTFNQINSSNYFAAKNPETDGPPSHPLPAAMQGSYSDNCEVTNAGIAGTIAANNLSNAQGQAACEAQNGEFLADILCGLIDTLNDAIQYLYNFTLGRLEFQLLTPVPTASNEITGLAAGPYNNVHASWLVVVRLASTLMIIVFLIMIIGQAAGNYIDAYTAKKILPRIVIAFIAINLSWYIAGFAMAASDIIGEGIKAVMLAPFGQNAAIIVSGTNAAYTLLGGLLAGGVAAALLIAGAGLFILVPVILGAVLAVTIGFFFVVIRQGLLIALTVFLPVAIVLWVLPGTRTYFNKYRDIFFGTIIVFPIFQAVLAMGALLAYVITAGNESDAGQKLALIPFMISIVCLFAPYFFLPKIAEKSVGLLGTISGMINNQGRGLHARSRKMVSDQSAKNRAKSGAGQRYKEGSVMDKLGMNKVAAVGTGRNVLSQKGKDRIAGARNVRTAETARKMHAEGYLDMFSGREFAEFGQVKGGKALENRAREMMNSSDHDTRSTGRRLLAMQHWAGDQSAVMAAAMVAAEGGKLESHQVQAVGRMLSHKPPGEDITRDGFIDGLWATQGQRELVDQFNRTDDFDYSQPTRVTDPKTGKSVVNDAIYSFSARDEKGVVRTVTGEEAITGVRNTRFWNDFGKRGKFNPGDVASIRDPVKAKRYADQLLNYTADHHRKTVKAKDDMAMWRNVYNDPKASAENKERASAEYNAAQRAHHDEQIAATRGAKTISFLASPYGQHREGIAAAMVAHIDDRRQTYTDIHGDKTSFKDGSFGDFLSKNSMNAEEMTEAQRELLAEEAAQNGPHQSIVDPPKNGNGGS